MTNCIVYVHGKGGNTAESKHYEGLFPGSKVIGLEYQNDVPWKANEEIFSTVNTLKKEYKEIILIANSIGAYFSMHAGIDGLIKKAYFISPIVDMEGMIRGLMKSIALSEEELKIKGRVATPFGEDITWEYLCFVRENPIRWAVPTHILYGSKDNLTPYETIKGFADRFHATLTVLDGGEHWFHTEEQMKFLDQWIGQKEREWQEKNTETKLTVFFEDPFWVGVFERVEGKKLYAGKVTFGAEPTDAQLNEFVLKSYADLTFSPAVKSEIKVKADNPKRRFKIVKNTLREIGVGTKAQQALKAQQEMRKAEQKSINKVRREEDAERKFILKQEKKKEKHKGH